MLLLVPPAVLGDSHHRGEVDARRQDVSVLFHSQLVQQGGNLTGDGKAPTRPGDAHQPHHDGGNDREQQGAQAEACALALNGRSHVFYEFLDRSVDNEAYLQTHDAYLTELSPKDDAAIREKGVDMVDAMRAATTLAIEEAKARMARPEFGNYAPSFLARGDNSRHSGGDGDVGGRKLAALEGRRCVRQGVSAALSTAAEKAARDLDQAAIGLRQQQSHVIQRREVGAALEDLDLVEKVMRAFDSGKTERAANDASGLL